MPDPLSLLHGVPATLSGDRGARHGDGAGNGAGNGAGDGAGARHGHGEKNHSNAPTQAPAPSRARPPELVYPKKDGPEREGQVFVVLLTIDKDGYVDGVRLRQGVNPHKDRKALDAIWRFRYRPALDDNGRPIAYKLVQRFMLE